MTIHLYNTETVAAKSLKNCHAPGVDSIVLGEGDKGELVRVFWARKGHSLGVRHPSSDQLQIAFHNHHCGLYFTVLQGCIINCKIDAANGCQRGALNKWGFQSKIIAPENPGFVRQDGCIYTRFQSEILTPDDDCRTTSMDADTYHTVFVPSEEAIWLLHEYPSTYGRDAKKVVYSNSNLSNFSFDGLYQPFTSREEIQYVLDITAPWV